MRGELEIRIEFLLIIAVTRSDKTIQAINKANPMYHSSYQSSEIVTLSFIYISL